MKKKCRHPLYTTDPNSMVKKTGIINTQRMNNSFISQLFFHKKFLLSSSIKDMFTKKFLAEIKKPHAIINKKKGGVEIENQTKK